MEKCPVAVEGAATCETEDTSRTLVFAVSVSQLFLVAKDDSFCLRG